MVINKFPFHQMVAAQPVSMTAYLAGRGPLTLPGGATGLAFTRTKFAYDDPAETRPDIELVMGAGSLAGDFFGMLRSLLGNLIRLLYLPTYYIKRLIILKSSIEFLRIG